MKVLHIITGLGTGGAEMMLYKLLSTETRENIEYEVISLSGLGPVAEKISALGVPVRALGMERGMPSVSLFWKLRRWIVDAEPDLVQSWMYHSDLLGGVAARLAGGRPVIWGIRNSDLVPGEAKRSTILVARLCARLSRFVPTKILCCSEASRKVHAALGYSGKKMVVVPNGFDLGTFQPDANARQSVMAELGLERGCFLIGHVARFDPQKDHPNFIAAAKRLLDHFPQAHFLLCGDNIERANHALVAEITNSELRHHFHLLGRRNDVARLVAAFDIAVSSSSFGEGFPNVIGEAMACAVPCVVTDVGDSALIVGETGRVVESRSPQALAGAMAEMLSLSTDERSTLARAARERVKAQFSLPQIVRRYHQLYAEVLEEGR